MKRVLALALAMVMALSLAACGGSGDTSTGDSGSSGGNVVRIGVFEPATGDSGPGGKQEMLGMQYANKETPTVDIGGTTYNVELVYADNGSTTDKAPTAAAELVSKDVSLVLGSYGSSVAMAGGPVFDEAGLAAIGVTCTNPNITAGNDYYFRICFLDNFQAQVLVNFAKDKFSAQKAYCLGELGNEYDQGLIAFFEQNFDGEVIKDSFPTNTSDFTTYLNKAVAEDVDVIFCPVSIAYATQIVGLAASMGLDIPLLGSDTLDSNVVLEAAQGSNVQLYVSTFYQEGGSPKFDDGIKAWLNEDSTAMTNNGGNDTIAAVTAMGYDAYYVALAGRRHPGPRLSQDRRHRQQRLDAGEGPDCGISLPSGQPGGVSPARRLVLARDGTASKGAAARPFWRRSFPLANSERKGGIPVQYGISILLSGISLGGQYALIAIGYTMVYGILRLINFAHGDVFMAAGLIMVYLSASLPIGVALPLMILLTVLLGFVIERAAYKPLRSAPRMSVMISAIGVSYLLQNLATYITGGLPQMYPSLPGLSSQITIAGTSTKMVTVITPFLVVALVVVLTQLINHTKIGMAMRAASRDFETAQLMGIKINNIISFTFVIGSFLAAVGSALYFTNYPSIVPLSGSLPGLRAFVAAVFGGIGSIPGAVVGAFLIGLSETVIKSSNWSVFSDAFTFALLIIILVVKPTGLIGEKSTDKV